MPYQLDLNMETLFLLVNSPWQEENKARAIRILDSTGVDGAAFYERNGPLVDRYYAAFEKERAASADAEMLSQADELLLGIYMGLLQHHPDWLAGIGDQADDALSDAVKRQLIRILEGEKDVISGLERLGFPDQSKWRVMLLLQKPRAQLGAFFGAVSANLPAARKARDSVAGELEKLLAQFEGFAGNTYGAWPLDLSRATGPASSIIPTLAMPFSILVSEDVCFCGLLCSKLLRSARGTFDKEELLVCAKALSDKSKVEILLLLKQESLYGLEIADRMGLTPATVSHHMGTLLASGFVEMEKRGLKVFYRLSETGIQKFLSGTGRLLL